MNRRSFLSMFGGAVASTIVKPTYFLAPAGGWNGVYDPKYVNTYRDITDLYEKLTDPIHFQYLSIVEGLPYLRDILIIGENLITDNHYLSANYIKNSDGYAKKYLLGEWDISKEQEEYESQRIQRDNL